MHGEIHIPLVVRMPGQRGAREVLSACDQTALAPTILQIAGLPQPAWMPSQPLSLSGTPPGDAGLGFTQVLDGTFGVISRGSIGVVDGSFQYVMNLEDRQGKLRRWAVPGQIDVDLSTEHPQVARRLRQVLLERFLADLRS